MTTIPETTGSPYLVTVSEAARLLGVKPWPVMELCQAGELPSRLIGRVRVIPAVAVRELAGGVR